MDSVAFSITVPRTEEDEWVGFFCERGAVGAQVRDFESDPVTLRVFFPLEMRNALEATLDELRSRSPAIASQGISLDGVPDEDWLRQWRESLHPFEVGETFRVVPTSCAESPGRASSRTVLHMEPGMAFGTGTHESTQLCLRALEKMHLKGMNVLDVGTGAGILAIAAVLRDAKSVFACDVDPVAVTVAFENFNLNGVTGRIHLWNGSLESLRSASVDVCFANLTAGIFESLWPELKRVILPGGRLVCSGILREQAMSLELQLREHHFSPERTEYANEWAAFVARKER